MRANSTANKTQEQDLSSLWDGSCGLIKGQSHRGKYRVGGMERGESESRFQRKERFDFSGAA